MRISARSISFRAAGILCPGVRGRVLASFDRVCDLVTDGGAVVALVWGGVGDGPLNIVLEREPGTALPAGARFAVGGQGEAFPGRPTGAMHPVSDERRLSFSSPSGNPSFLEIRLSPAVPWDPRPDWEALRRREEQIAAAASALREALATDVGPYLKKRLACACPMNGAGLVALDAIGRAGTAVLDACRDDDRAALARAISALCGLGPGLTPAGDDWLAGWLLGLHLAPDPPDLSGFILEIAGQRTTTLSRAFLECAAAGEADAGWHALLAALAGEPTDGRTAHCARAILAHGSTSGAAMLAGFLAGVERLVRRNE